MRYAATVAGIDDYGQVILAYHDVTDDEFRAGVARFNDRTRFIDTPAYDRYCETHESCGGLRAPEFATFRTGIVYCAICEKPTEDGGDLCRSCLHAVEPWREDLLPVCDPNAGGW